MSVSISCCSRCLGNPTPASTGKKRSDWPTWIYSFDASGNVTWRDPGNGQNGKGTWKNAPGLINFQWANSTTTESWKTQIKPSEQKGTTTMKGTTYEVNTVRL